MGSIKIILIGAVLTVGLIVGLAFLGSKQVPDKAEPKFEGEAQLIRDYSPRKGASPENAKVTIVEFADLQCPACAATAPAIAAAVEKNPDVALIFRHFPLDQHVNGLAAARAAEAANAQGKFFEFEKIAYERQGEWGTLSDPKSKFEEYAAELGLNVDQFKSDSERDDLLEHISIDMGDAQTKKVSATPTLFINGTLYEGARDEAGLQATIEQIRGSAQ